MLLVFLKGLAVGLLAGVPLGPASAAVVDTAVRHSRRKAVALGTGAALVDLAYCLAACLGFGALLHDRPDVAEALRLLGSLVLGVLGVAMWLRPPEGLESPPARREVRAGTLVAAAGTGVAISAVNPALATTWIVLAGTVFAGLGVAESAVASAGVFLGTGAWFLALALAAHRGRAALGPRAAWITRAAGGLLVLYGLVLLLRPAAG